MELQVQKKLSLSLLLLRLSIFLVFFLWGLDKIILTEHAVKVFSTFYGINISEGAMMSLGILQTLFLFTFVCGLFKNKTYLIILVLHLSSTLSSFPKYMEPFSNLLFFTAWPMLAACFALYLLRDFDTYSVDYYRLKNKLNATA